MRKKTMNTMLRLIWVGSLLAAVGGLTSTAEAQNILERQYYQLQFKTASDQFLRIGDNGVAGGSRVVDERALWLFVPTGNAGEYWIFNKGARGGRGQALTLPSGKSNFGQWDYTGHADQKFKLVLVSDGFYRLVLKSNGEAISGRWNNAAFTFKVNKSDDQQLFRLVPKNTVQPGDTLANYLYWQMLEPRIRQSLEPVFPPLNHGNRYVNEAVLPGSFISNIDAAQPWIAQYSKEWLTRLPDSVKLCDVSLPGTHDSGAKRPFILSQTQSWSILGQLQAGVRFLDIRLRRTGKSFAIHHGAVFQNMMFGDVMNQVVSFFVEAPREAIVMFVREEYTAEEGSDSFEKIWNSYVSTYSNVFYKMPNPLVSGAETPTLGDLRGKVFVMYEHGDCSGQGIRWGIPSKQNMWSLDPLDLKPKIKAITDQMTSARNGSGNWTVNFLSASAPPHEPFQIANIMNKLAYDSIGGAGTKQRLGIMPMDYPGEKLIYRIIRSNF